MRPRSTLLCVAVVLGVLTLTREHTADAVGAAPARIFRVDGDLFTAGDKVPADGSIATAAHFDSGVDVAVAPDGSWLTASGGLVWRLGLDGRISRVAGTGVWGFSGDGGPALTARIRAWGVAVMPDGGVLLAERDNGRVRRVAPDGAISTVAGSMSAGGFAGDGGPATAARLNAPADVAPTPDGGFLIADTNNDRIRRVDAAGVITTVAGRSPSKSARPGLGDGGPATEASLSGPEGVAAAPDGGFLIADTRNNRVARVSPDGIIGTVAGSHPGDYPAFSGDGGPATRARLDSPEAVAIGPDGGVVIADTGNGRVRTVRPDGRIETVAGSAGAADHPSLGTDDGYAINAAIDPHSVAITPDGGLAIAASQLWFVAPPATRRIAVAEIPVQARASRRSYAAQVVTTVPARVKLTVFRHGRRVRETAVTTPAQSVTTVRLNGALPSDVYGVRIVATTDDRAAATDETTLILGGSITTRLARRALNQFGFEESGDDQVEVAGCHRFGLRRMDCELKGESDSSSSLSCRSVFAVRLTLDGSLDAREYGCHGRRLFRLHPHWASPRFGLGVPIDLTALP